MPRVGGPETGNIESVVAVHPDLVVLTTMQEPFIAKDLHDFGLKYLVVPSESLSDIFESIRSIGEATHHRAQATHLSDQMRNSLESIRAQTKDLPRPTVLLSVSRMPGSLSQLYVATAGSFLIDLIDIAGGRSIAAPSKIGYSNMSKEAILRLNPQIIVDVRHKSDSSLAEEGLSAWEELPELRALREKHIYAVNAPFVAHPSQFVTDTARLFVHLLHPDLRATNPGHD
jgi:iron complex transport system substrate-binding protein